MSLSPQEAVQNLKDADATQRRSAEVYGYRIASDYLILWGLVWLVGYGVSDLRPQLANIAWATLILLAIAAGFLFPRRAGSQSAGKSWHFLGLSLILFFFIGATYAVMWPVSPVRQGAFIPLIVAALYSGVGLWMGVRFVVAGIVVAALTLGGYFFLHAHFMLWMAFVGGGALMLAGLWFRRA